MRAIALLALCFAAVAAVPKNPQRIVGGSVTTIDQYPSMASLLLSWAGEAFTQVCGGTIINNRSVLTAAHCVFESHPSQWKIRVGSTYANSGGVVHNLQSILIHPDLSQTLDNDIAMIRIATSFSFNNNVQPASIAGPNYNLADNTVVWASGWGETSANGTQSEQLRHVQIWTINQNICTERYATLYLPISENMLCSGWLDVGGRDQCQGDSGGPLYHNGVLVGVCSFGWGCGDPYFPGINVRVSRYTSWIQSNA